MHFIMTNMMWHAHFFSSSILLVQRQITLPLIRILFLSYSFTFPPFQMKIYYEHRNDVSLIHVYDWKNTIFSISKPFIFIFLIRKNLRVSRFLELCIPLGLCSFVYAFSKFTIDKNRISKRNETMFSSLFNPLA